MYSSRIGGPIKALKRFNPELSIQTPRLIIHPLDLEDLYHYVHHYELVHQSLDAHCIIDAHDPDIVYAFERAYYEATAAPENYLWYTSWELILKGENEIVGGLCFKGPPDDEGLVEIGYAVYEPHQLNGYATEGLNALIAWAFQEPTLQGVIASVESSNSASISVLKKLGFELSEKGENLDWWQKKK